MSTMSSRGCCQPRRAVFRTSPAPCREPAHTRFALAELSSWLAGLAATELQNAVALPAPRSRPYLANYIAGMVEYACAERDVAPPAWTREIAPLPEPVLVPRS